jgi:hypothetical protein
MALIGSRYRISQVASQLFRNGDRLARSRSTKSFEGALPMAKSLATAFVNARLWRGFLPTSIDRSHENLLAGNKYAAKESPR